MEDSLFMKIIKGEIPCHKVYEDEHTLAFLDIHPAREGHTLVIPKQQVEFVWDLDDATYHQVMTTVKKVAHRLKAIYPNCYIGELVVGTDVPHAHVHLLPFSDSKEILKVFSATSDQPNHDTLKLIAQKLYFDE